MKGEPDNISYYLEVLIPPINPKVSDPLSIVTYPRQVIISWIGGSHRHFDSWPIQPYPFYMEKAIEFVEAIVADKIIFGYYEHGGEPTGAGFCSHVTTNNPPVKVETAQVGSVIIRSWLGAHDRELHDFPI